MSLLRVLFFISIVSFIFSSCDGGSTTKQQSAAEKPIAPKLQPAGKLVANTLPSIQEKEMQNIWNTCTNVDFVFYDYSFSMNQTESASIKSTLSYVSTTVPSNLDSGCKPIGRIFYVANGEGLAEAEFFLGNVCNYFIFYKDGKQVAANMMTPKGEEFLKSTIQKVTKGMPK